MKQDSFAHLSNLFLHAPAPSPALPPKDSQTGDNRESSLFWTRRILLPLGFLAMAALVYMVRNTLIPLFLSMLIAYLLMPLADFMENRGIGRIAASSVTFLLFFGLLFLIGLYLVPLINQEWASLRSGLPDFIGTVNDGIARVQGRLSEHWPAVQEVDVRARIQKFVLNTLDSIPSFVVNIFSIFPLLVLVPLISFFFLKDARKIKKAFLNRVPNRYFEMALGLLYEIDRKIGSYIRGQILRSIIVGFLTFIGLSLFGLNYALVLAIFAGVMNLVPYAGPLIAAIPAVILAFLGQAAPHAMGTLILPLPLLFQVVIVFSAVQTLDAVWIAPYVLGRSVDISPLGIVLLLLFGNQLFGLWGIVLAVPVASILRLVAQATYRRYAVYRR